LHACRSTLEDPTTITPYTLISVIIVASAPVNYTYIWAGAFGTGGQKTPN